MLKFVYFAFLIISIAASLVSAYYWHEASKVEVDLGYMGTPEQPMGPVVDPGLLTLRANVAAGAATMAYIQSSDLNKKAARYAAIAAIGVAGYSICSYFIGCCQ